MRETKWITIIPLIAFLIVATPGLIRATPRYKILTIAHPAVAEEISSVGDIDGDQIPDFVLGDNGFSELPTYPTLSGRVELFSGATLLRIAEIRSTTTQMRLGSSVSAIGDINSDGVPDVLVGASGFFSVHCEQSYSPSSRIFIYSGQGLLQTPPQSVVLFSYIGSQNSEFGSGVARVGNLDGSPGDEFVVASPYGTRDTPCSSPANGKAYYFSKNGLISSASTGNYHQVAAIGDVNGDGKTDWAYAGLEDYISIYSGATHAYAAAINLHEGHSVSKLGDLDSDGGEDFLASADDYGSIKVLRSDSQWTLSVYKTITATLGLDFGRGLTWLSDFDGDGKNDFVSLNNGSGGQDFGFVTIYSGGKLGGPNEVIASYPISQKLEATANLGDLNGDGYDDFGVTTSTSSTGSLLIFQSDSSAQNRAIISKLCAYESACD